MSIYSSLEMNLVQWKLITYPAKDNTWSSTYHIANKAAEKQLRLFFLILAIQAYLAQNIEGLSQILRPKNGRLIRLIRSGGHHA